METKICGLWTSVIMAVAILTLPWLKEMIATQDRFLKSEQNNDRKVYKIYKIEFQQTTAEEV